MSEEERILRLENAISMLAGLAAEQQRLSAEQQRQAAEQQRRTTRLDESFVMLTEMLRRHGESFDELRSAQAESEHKIAALVDAQIRIEEAHSKGREYLRAGMEELRAAQADTNKKFAALADTMKQLAETQAHTDQRLDALIDFVREQRNGRG